MNFTSELSAFQGAILSADNIHPFKKITARGGNEDKILDIVTRLYTFLKEKQYISNEGVVEQAKSDLRKFTFYLFLNSDFPILEDLVEMPGIDMVIWTIPIITKCLISEMVWGLNMEIYLYEIIAFCNPMMAIDVLQPFLDSLRHSTPTQCLSKLKIISGACYRLICRQHFFNYDVNILSPILSTFYQGILRCLEYYSTPPNVEKLMRLPQDDKYRHMGHNLYSIVSLVLDCLTHFTSIEKFSPEGFEEMYLCTIKPESIKTRNLTQKVSEIQEGPVLEYLNKCNTALLDKCVDLVMEVSVDIFCAWSEFNDSGKSMQRSVGELCYLLNSKLERTPVLCDHHITAMLPQISCKPVDVHDIIRAADIDTIIDNVNQNTENKSLWLQALIQKDNLCRNMDCIECLIKNVEFIKEEESLKLLEILMSYLVNNETPDNDLLQMLSSLLICQIEGAAKDEIIEHHFCNRMFNNRLENSETTSMITEIFNKLIATPDAKLTDVLNVFIQNPLETFTMIINTAVENIKQCEIMLKVMEMLKAYSDHFYVTDAEPCIVKIIESYPHDRLESDVQRINFAHFVIELKKSGFLSGAKLLLFIMMPNLHKALLTKDNNLIQIHIKIINGSYTMEELTQYRAPILVMLAQVLEVTRWTPITFTDNSQAELREDALRLQIEIMNSYNNAIPERELSWMKTKLRQLAPLNMYYYRKLWDPPGDNFIEIVSGRKLNTEDELIMFLAKVLLQITSMEWDEVWKSLRHRGPTGALALLYRTVVAMAPAEASNRSEQSWRCFKHCYWNLLLITKNKYLVDPVTDDQLETVVNEVVNMVNVMDEKDLEEISTPVLSLFSYIREKKHSTVAIADLTKSIRHAKFRTMVNKVFTNGAA